MPDRDSVPRLSECTVFVCPVCDYWRGESEGLYSKPSSCPKCVRKAVGAKPWGARGVTTVKDMQDAPTLVAVGMVAPGA